MTVITKMPNPMDPKKPFTFAKGRIKIISIKAHTPGAKDTDENGLKVVWIRQAGQPDKKVESTHKASVLLQEVDDNNALVPDGKEEWINLGDQKLHPNHTDKLQIKEGDVFVTLLQGMIVTIPLKISTSADGREFVNGSKAKMTILDRSNVVQPGTAAQHNKPATTSAGGLTKVFGEISAIDGLVATVKTETGDKEVTLTKEQVDEIKVGGRLAAMVDGAGVAKSGFKAYGQAIKSGTGHKKDDTGVKAGNAINVVALMQGYADIDSTAAFSAAALVLGQVDIIRDKLAKEFTSLDAYTVGVTLGLAAKLVAPRFPVTRAGDEEVGVQIEQMFRDMIAFEATIRDASTPATPAPAAAPAKTTKAKAQAQTTPAPANDLPPVTAYVGPQGSWQAGMDFDDDIPFAPVGLQYPWLVQAMG